MEKRNHVALNQVLPEAGRAPGREVQSSDRQAGERGGFINIYRWESGRGAEAVHQPLY